MFLLWKSVQIKSLNSHNWLNRSTNVPPLDSRFACRQYNQSADAIYRAKYAKAGKEIARESSKNGWVDDFHEKNKTNWRWTGWSGGVENKTRQTESTALQFVYHY